MDITELKKHGIYEIKSRNLTLGVWDGDQGFVGIREKFGSEFLFTEYLSRNCGGSNIGLDTATPIKMVGMLADSIPLDETLGSKCVNCDKEAWWTGPPAPAPWACEGECDTTSPCAISNKKLFEVLKAAHELRAKEGKE